MIQLSNEEVAFFRQKAVEKINAEGWEGRNVEQKVENFANCWITEEAFKQLLIKQQAFFRHRGLYVGDAAGAGVDFEFKRNGAWISVGIRSINEDSLNKWKSVAYPEDRFLNEQQKIPDYVVACHNDNGSVAFLGMISKKELLDELGRSRRLRSRTNQELFRTVPLDKFSKEKLIGLLEELDKR